MDIQFILDTLRAVKLELYRRRVAATVLFMVVTAGVLALGYITPKSYTSQAVLYADQSNILQPLLRGQAEVTQIDRINEAREMIQSRSFLEQVAMDTGLISTADTDQDRTVAVGNLRKQVDLRVSNRNFLELSYTSGDPNQSFQVMSAVLNRFVERTVRKKRSESQGAFEFIDSQVKSYQRQLEEAEQKLKEFKSNNQDGTESNVRQRIETLRADIENLKLEIQQTESEVALTKKHLAQEEPVRKITTDPGKSSAERRLASLRQELDSLLLKYQEKHPDVVSVKDQIADLEKQVSTQGDHEREGAVTQVMEN
ncbi:MAG: variable large family protein, partial [Marinobacter sp.]|nr:variable large family protein [Marinobacter sp.]